MNVIAYRIIHENIPFFYARSCCPQCKSIIKWYDNIPVFSWIFLQRKCRSCKQSISFLYPFIELLTIVSLFLLISRINQAYLPAYFIFFSALIITVRTDLETMLISRYVSLFLIPCGLLLSYYNFLPLSFYESLIGALSGYALLYAIAQGYYLITKKIGMGVGDIELLAFIGSFTGIAGWWLSLLIGSFLATAIGSYIVITQKGTFSTIKIPFGPFLALGAQLYILFQPSLIKLLFNLFSTL